MANPKRKGLGRGLNALIGEGGASFDAPTQPGDAPQTLPDGSRFLWVDPRELSPNPQQPRQHFDEDALAELTESIKRDGVQEPVIVREHDGELQLISGERRARASVLADVPHIPAVCRVVPDADLLKLGLIENVQREDLNPLELAQGYQRLMEAFGWTQERVAEEVGKKRATVANTLRLMQLPADVQQMVGKGALSMGHAKALLAIEDVAVLRRAANKIVAQGLSVRQAEELAQRARNGATTSGPGAGSKPDKDPHVAALEDELRHRLGTRVALRQQAGQRGKIEIEYHDLDQLDRILGILRGQ